MADRPMACPEWRDDLAGWLVAQLPPEREVALEEHRRTCAACRAEADSLLAVAAVTLGSDRLGSDVSADLGDRITAQVTHERRTRRAVRASFALAGAVALALAAVVATRPNPTPPLRGRAVAFVVQPEGVEAGVVVAADGGGSLVDLTATGLDPDTVYALWLTPPGGGYPERVAAGTFRPNERGAVDERLHSALPASDASRVWVTDPAGAVTLDSQHNN